MYEPKFESLGQKREVSRKKRDLDKLKKKLHGNLILVSELLRFLIRNSRFLDQTDFFEPQLFVILIYIFRRKERSFEENQIGRFAIRFAQKQNSARERSS